MVPLTVHSYYSLMWGTCSPEKICAVAKQRGYRRLAITDTDNLYGLWPFLKHCEQEDITPIVGAEVGALPEHRLQREGGAEMRIQLVTEVERREGALGDDAASQPGQVVPLQIIEDPYC